MGIHDGAKNKLERVGAENLTNEELVRAFLDSCGQSQKINQLVSHFWDTIGDIAGYGLLSENEKRTIFKEIPDVTIALEAGIELGRRIQKQPIHLLGKVLGSAQLGELMISRFQKEPQEHLLLLCLDTKNQIKREVVVFKGGLNSAEVHPREIMVEVLRVSANSFILVHNHPSGNVEPSANDLAFTKKMKKVGELMGVRLIDHLIIGDQSYWSAAEKRVLND
jgi:DNA repair protein RadC